MSEPSVVPASNPITPNISPVEITSRKTAMCMVSLGEAIMDELVGKEISNISNENRSDLFCAIINNELKLS